MTTDGSLGWRNLIKGKFGEKRRWKKSRPAVIKENKIWQVDI